MPFAALIFAASLAQIMPSPAPANAARDTVLPPVPAIESRFPTVPGPLPSGNIVGNNEPFVGLSLEAAVAMALGRNTDLVLSQGSRRIAGFAITAAEGAYDLRLQIAPSFSTGTSAAVNSFQTGPGGGGITQTSAGLSATVSGQGTGGTRYTVGTSATRVNNNGTSNSYDPFYATALSLNLTKPLVRGATIDEPRRQIALARIGRDQSTDALRVTASSVVASAVGAYYDLVAGWRNVAIQEDALRQASAQSRSNARLVRAGQAAPVDVVESDAQVQLFQDNVFSAVQNVSRLQNQLKVLMLGNPSDPIWLANLVPTSFTGQLPAEPKLDDVVLAAIKQRPEIGQVRAASASAEVNRRFALDQIRPQIDLQLNLAENGFAGTATDPRQNPLTGTTFAEIGAINALITNANRSLPPGQQIPLVSGPTVAPPGFQNGGLGQSYGNLFAGRNPSATASLVIGLPLRNRTANANAAIAREQVQLAQTQEIALIQRIQFEARNAVQAYRSGRSRLIAARAARAAAEAVEASEERRFRAGNSTTFLVLQRQVALATQRSRELQAQTDLQKALLELDRVSGDVFARYGVDVAKLGTSQ